MEEIEVLFARLIPGGYEKDNSKPVYTDHERILIPVKKEEEKNFEWYVEEYFRYHFSFYRKSYIHYLLKTGEYNEVDFGIKIGLLKFICDDLDRDFQSIIGKLGTHITGISNIIPKDFLTSIFPK